VTPLHRQFLAVLGDRPTEDIFIPEKVREILDSPKAQVLLRAVDGSSREDLVVGALRALAMQRDAMETAAIGMELVATMPGYGSSATRDTEACVLDLVNAARRQAIVVGYGLTNARFVEALHVAGARGVDIVMITDRRSEHGRKVLRDWPSFLSPPRVYQERSTDLHEMAKMHGKALLVDGTRLFVSSANFTWLAMNANIEIGVVLTGSSVVAAQAMFEELLVDSGLLERVSLG